MDRRSFIATLIGGLTAAGFGSVTMAAAKETATAAQGSGDAGAVADGARLETKALDQTDAEFAQYYYRRRPYWRRRYYRPRFYSRRYYYRPLYYRRRWRRW